MLPNSACYDETMPIKKIDKHTVLIVGTIVGFLLIMTGTLLMSRDTANAPEGGRSEEQSTPPEPTETTPAESPPTTTPETSTFNKNQYSTSDASSPWVVVNKKNPLPNSYAPAGLTTVSGKQLRKEAADAMTSLLAAARDAGTPMNVISGYRSYANQQSVYNNYVQRDGQAAADRYSARPGFSEHQTGLAADLGTTSGSCALEICFADTAQGKWLATHAHEYGFIIRYPKDAENRTGYQYEPWHIRYIGTELAAEIYQSNQTLEEFFGLPGAPGY